ncbi:hypothetical protein BOS5A_80164 [Bosea sp. EC-HK365B]|nr:hypothetical protein BOSE21B_111555 [Bosea sp. 21B]CAD5269349.1 hypothetical protein BOSE7B_20083 [Bosea sp. 7B]VVT62504.1 hypothetical protein BOS5A_80164 [Bosea sp. EC-HK365B]VXC63039.1 hypothetical protein BOSE127_30097 [Bosea sp. 127]
MPCPTGPSACAVSSTTWSPRPASRSSRRWSPIRSSRCAPSRGPASASASLRAARRGGMSPKDAWSRFRSRVAICARPASRSACATAGPCPRRHGHWRGIWRAARANTRQAMRELPRVFHATLPLHPTSRRSNSEPAETLLDAYFCSDALLL